MSLLTDRQIRQRVMRGELGIHPFIDHKVSVKDGKDIISYGLSHAGYDLRVDRGVIVSRNDLFHKITSFLYNADPRDFDESLMKPARYDEARGAYIIPPFTFGLAVAVERIAVPNDVLVTVVAKSTYNRVGMHINVTPFEPGWKGYPTLEFWNSSPVPVSLYPDQGIAQMLFHKLDGSVDKTYDGKYQDQQAAITFAKV